MLASIDDKVIASLPQEEANLTSVVSINGTENRFKETHW